ncbi:MAG: site-specific integrase [Coriobacteriales bacterium]|nr:site-specific integrase [Coriobacteriales bacterium]
MSEWLAEYRQFAKEGTFATYSMAVVNHIIPLLGDCALDELTEDRVQEAVLFWLRSGRCDGTGGLSHKSVRDLLAIVKTSVKAAHKHLGLALVPMEIRLPQPTRLRKVEVFSPSELLRLVEAAKIQPSSKNAGILLALYSGLRIGELCALQWKDVDFERGSLFVSKTVQRIYARTLDGGTETRVVISTPKTRSSLREIPLASAVLPSLREFRSNGECYLTTKSPAFLEPRSYRSYYGRFLKRAGIAHSSFHKLRHTFATQLIEHGADVKTVSELLGHASVNTTLDLYVHPQFEQKQKCIEMMPPFS